MYNPQNHVQQLVDHIKKNLAKGYTSDALKVSLINQGYSRISVEKAIEIANQQLASTIPLIKEKPQITYKVFDESFQPISISTSEKKSFFKRLFKR